MSIADSRLLPVVGLLRWWPAALCSQLLVGTLVAAVQFGPALPMGLRDSLTPLAEWKLVLAEVLALTVCFGAVIDLVSLRARRREIESFDSSAPRSSRVYQVYQESKRRLPPQPDLGQVLEAIAQWRVELAARLMQGWVLKYYALCMVLPLVG